MPRQQQPILGTLLPFGETRPSVRLWVKVKFAGMAGMRRLAAIDPIR